MRYRVNRRIYHSGDKCNYERGTIVSLQHLSGKALHAVLAAGSVTPIPEPSVKKVVVKKKPAKRVYTRRKKAEVKKSVPVVEPDLISKEIQNILKENS